MMFFCFKEKSNQSRNVKGQTTWAHFVSFLHGLFLMMDVWTKFSFEPRKKTWIHFHWKRDQISKYLCNCWKKTCKKFFSFLSNVCLDVYFHIQCTLGEEYVQHRLKMFVFVNISFFFTKNVLLMSEACFHSPSLMNIEREDM